MPTITLTTTIDAPPARVWRALCDPGEVVRWDNTVIEALDAPAGYPQPGQHVQWRVHDSPTLLHDRPQHVEPNRRLHAYLDYARQHIDETYTLTTLDGDYTQLDLTLHVTNRTAILGPLLVRLVDAPSLRRSSQASITALKRHCEA